MAVRHRRRRCATACGQGSAADCQALATGFRTGGTGDESVKPDPALAARFSDLFVRVSQKSCAAGGSDACFVLGVVYTSGTDVPLDRERGVALLQKACGAGNEPACA